MDIDKNDRIYKLALSTAGVGVWEYDLCTNELKWSAEMHKLHGNRVDRLDLSYESWLSCLHPNDIGRERKNLLLAIKRRNEYDSTYRIIWPDGKIRYIKAQAIIERDSNGSESKIIGTNWDVTDIVLAHEELHISKKEFEGAFEYSTIGMAIVSLEGNWLKVNNKACDITGYSFDELIKLTFQDITHPDDLEKDLSLVKKMIDREISTYQMEKRYFHKLGHVVWVLLSVSMVVDNLDRPMYFISQIEDITESKLANQRLENNLALTQKQNDRLLNFAHIVSHNLRSHTGNLSMILSLMDEEMNPEKLSEFFNHIKQISTALKSTVDHLTEVVKIQTSEQLERVELDLHDYIARALSTIKADIISNDVLVINNVPLGSKIFFTPAYLDSVLLNFLTNCIKYRSPNRRLEIKIEAGQKDDQNYFSISDNGLGIDLTRFKKKLFGLHETFHKNKDSSGVGLFITKNQIDAYGGQIDVLSEPDVGTTFKIFLPRPA